MVGVQFKLSICRNTECRVMCAGRSQVIKYWGDGRDDLRKEGNAEWRELRNMGQEKVRQELGITISEVVKWKKKADNRKVV